MGGVAEELLKEVGGVALGDRHMAGFVVFDLGICLNGQAVPIGHQPFDKVIGFFVIGGRKLGRIRRIKVSEVSLHLGKDLVNISAIGFVLLAVVKYQGVDPLDIRFQAFLNSSGCLTLAVSVEDEKWRSAFATHAGLPRQTARYLFISGQIVAIGSQRVDERVNAFGKEDPFKIVLNKGFGFGVVRQQLFDLCLGQPRRTVFNNGSGCMVTVAKTVIGKNSQPWICTCSNNGRAGKGIQNGGNSVRGVTPDPVDQFLFAADVVGDVLGAFLRGLLFRSLPVQLHRSRRARDRLRAPHLPQGGTPAFPGQWQTFPSNSPVQSLLFAPIAPGEREVSAITYRKALKCVGKASAFL